MTHIFNKIRMNLQNFSGFWLFKQTSPSTVQSETIVYFIRLYFVTCNFVLIQLFLWWTENEKFKRVQYFLEGSGVHAYLPKRYEVQYVTL